MTKTILSALFIAFSFGLFAQEKESTGFLDKGAQQIGASIADMTSAEAYGTQLYLRYGYFVVNRFQVGLDVNAGVRDYNIAYGSFGPFLKLHLTDNWFSPFAVVSTDFGLCDFTDNRPKHYMSGKLSWDKYFVGAGIGFYGLKEHWGFEASAGYQHENYIRRDNGAPESFTNQWTLPIKWRISYSF
ncbi:MAG: hypothetical protein CL840_18580 [Crocinitomicaceae bacterium]|nr:hypothetical protein [Crocinitomicaceae bacterium]|tara:strand:+ start:1347 stop:1904 length:558 start_codon:yes stop_codon:yes gene_type:complete